ncbi:hypothetical protein, partial [Trinickia sp.]|uniref:hypothetical protein n=1 Tax=Trinickia sp. TaxID=2571163 RepID=UPI003F80FB1E
MSVTVTVRVAALLVLVRLSVAVKLTVRVALLGVTAVSVYVTDSSALCHWARVAPPAAVSVNTPVAELYEPAMSPIVEPLFAKASRSSALTNPPVMATVAEASVDVALSVSVSPASTATGVDVALSPATNAAEPESVVTCTGVTTST